MSFITQQALLGLFMYDQQGSKMRGSVQSMWATFRIDTPLLLLGSWTKVGHTASPELRVSFLAERSYKVPLQEGGYTEETWDRGAFIHTYV